MRIFWVYLCTFDLPNVYGHEIFTIDKQEQNLAWDFGHHLAITWDQSNTAVGWADLKATTVMVWAKVGWDHCNVSKYIVQMHFQFVTKKKQTLSRLCCRSICILKNLTLGAVPKAGSFCESSFVLIMSGVDQQSTWNRLTISILCWPSILGIDDQHGDDQWSTFCVDYCSCGGGGGQIEDWHGEDQQSMINILCWSSILEVGWGSMINTLCWSSILEELCSPTIFVRSMELQQVRCMYVIPIARFHANATQE